MVGESFLLLVIGWVTIIMGWPDSRIMPVNLLFYPGIRDKALQGQLLDQILGITLPRATIQEPAKTI